MESVSCGALPSGSGEKASVELGFRGRPEIGTSKGYLPNIRVVFTILTIAPNPRVARWENAMPLPSADTKAVCLVPKNPRCSTDTPSIRPSTFRASRTGRDWGGIVRKGRVGLASSQVKICPCECPPAIVVWSAEAARAVIDPHSTATNVS